MTVSLPFSPAEFLAQRHAEQERDAAWRALVAAHPGKLVSEITMGLASRAAELEEQLAAAVAQVDRLLAAGREVVSYHLPGEPVTSIGLHGPQANALRHEIAAVEREREGG